MISHYLQQKERDFLRKVFDALDDQKDGEVNVIELCDQFKVKFSLEMPYEEMQHAIRCIDFEDGEDDDDSVI